MIQVPLFQFVSARDGIHRRFLKSEQGGDKKAVSQTTPNALLKIRVGLARISTHCHPSGDQRGGHGWGRAIGRASRSQVPCKPSVYEAVTSQIIDEHVHL